MFRRETVPEPSDETPEAHATGVPGITGAVARGRTEEREPEPDQPTVKHGRLHHQNVDSDIVGPFPVEDITKWIAEELAVNEEVAPPYAEMLKTGRLIRGYSKQFWFGSKAYRRGCPCSTEWKRGRGAFVDPLRRTPLGHEIGSAWIPLTVDLIHVSANTLSMYPQSPKISKCAFDDAESAVRSLAQRAGVDMRDLIYRGEDFNVLSDHLEEQFAYNGSLYTKEFGGGLYTTPSLDLALTYADSGDEAQGLGFVYIFDFTDKGGHTVVQHTLQVTGYLWEMLVKSKLVRSPDATCSFGGDRALLDPFLGRDAWVLVGAHSNNFHEVQHCAKTCFI